MRVRTETRLNLTETDITTIIASYLNEHYSLGVKIGSYNVSLNKSGPYVEAVVTGNFDKNLKIEED